MRRMTEKARRRQQIVDGVNLLLVGIPAMIVVMLVLNAVWPAELTIW